MSDIRERVARAICRSFFVALKQPEDEGATDHYWSRFLPQADAALSECGYAEMIDALEELLKTTDVDGAIEYKMAREAAIAALSKARGKT